MVAEVLPGLVPVPQPEAALLLEAGYLLMEMGKLKDAFDVFTGVSALLPHSDVPHVALGNLEFSQGHYQRALKHHQEALRLRPQSALAHAHVGEALLFLKKTAEALEALEKSISLDPKSPAAAFAQALLEAHKQGAIGKAL